MANATRTLNVRWMIRRDMDQVMDLYHQQLQVQPSIDGWDTRGHHYLIQMLRQRNCIGMVAEDGDGKIAGFMIYYLEKYSLHVTEIHGSQEAIATLSDRLKDKLSNVRRILLECDVPVKNLDLQIALRENGWFAIDEHNGAILFQFRIVPDQSHPLHITHGDLEDPDDPCDLLKYDDYDDED